MEKRHTAARPGLQGEAGNATGERAQLAPRRQAGTHKAPLACSVIADSTELASSIASFCQALARSLQLAAKHMARVRYFRPAGFHIAITSTGVVSTLPCTSPQNSGPA